MNNKYINDQQHLQASHQNDMRQTDIETAHSNPPPTRPPLLSRPGLKIYCLEDLKVNLLVEAQLLLLTLAIGIQDAISYPDFRCFASNQTGNTVVLAVALAGQVNDLFDPANTGVSLAAFLAGAMATGQMGNFLGRRRRLWQVAIGLAQVLMVVGSAVIQYVHGAEKTGPWARGALALLAFASGSQVAGARAMRIPEITTAMATAAWVDLLIDEELFVKRNRSRNRRGLFLATLVVGSFVGAYTRKAIGSPNALIVSAAVKLVVVVAMLVTPGEGVGSNSEKATRS